jgi:hypothetical protein
VEAAAYVAGRDGPLEVEQERELRAASASSSAASEEVAQTELEQLSWARTLGDGEVPDRNFEYPDEYPDQYPA